MDNSFLDTIKHLFVNISNAWGNNQLVAGLVLLIIGGILGWLFTKFIPWIGKLIGRLLIWLWAIIRGNGADHAFEIEYLSWLINKHRYLGLLPARIVSARWGEKRTIVDLEEIYISLSLSAQSGDENWTEAYGTNTNSCRKSVWLNPRIIKSTR